MTQANPEQMQRLLAELWKNLSHEHDVLSDAVAALDWKTLSAALHRLKGAACLVDAVPLARACAALDADVQEEREASLAERWATLADAIAGLQADIEPHLNRMPTTQS
jgi:two-component system sensor histidine kinase EvgS